MFKYLWPGSVEIPLVALKFLMNKYIFHQSLSSFDASKIDDLLRAH